MTKTERLKSEKNCQGDLLRIELEKRRKCCGNNFR